MYTVKRSKKMKTNKIKAVGIKLLVFMLILVFNACESPTAVENDALEEAALLEVEELTELLGQELSLTPTQQSDMQSSLKRHQDQRNDPGFLWYVAADMQQTLTEEQKEELFALAARIQERGGLGQQGGPPGVRGQGNGQGPGGAPGQGMRGRPGGGQPGQGGFASVFKDLLTEEQITQIEAIQEAYHDQFEALHQSRRDKTITHEAFREEMKALREAMREEIEALLTDEQIAAIETLKEEHKQEMEARGEEREAERQELAEKVKAAMVDALGLTADQLAAIEALHEQLIADREALHEQMLNGELTREELKAAMDELRASEMEGLEGILDATQLEIVKIYEALRITRAARRARRNGQRNGGGGPGGQRGPGNGGPGQQGPGTEGPGLGMF